MDRPNEFPICLPIWLIGAHGEATPLGEWSMWRDGNEIGKAVGGWWSIVPSDPSGGEVK